MKEMQSKIKSFQNIVRSKDNEIRDLLDQSLKQSNESQKKVALLEQKMELQQRLQTDMKTQYDVKSDQSKVKSNEVKELMQIIKDLKVENKQMRSAVKEQMGAQSQAADLEKITEVQKHVDKLKIENTRLSKQIRQEQNQVAHLTDKYQRLEQQQRVDMLIKPHDETRDSQLLQEIETLSQQLNDAEKSNKVLRRIKNAYKQASEIKCIGCAETFTPVIFKAHVLGCAHIQQEV